MGERKSSPSVAELYADRRYGEPFIQRFVIGDDGCWLWNGAITTSGYPVGYAEGAHRSMHRAFYEWVVGPIPDGLDLDHLCRVRHCVNPDHLEPVTNRTNVLRGTSPAATNARKTHCKHGHEFTEDNTLQRPWGRVCRACNRERNRRHYRRKQREGTS